MLRIGIDLGGTKTEIIALDDQGQVNYSERVASPRDDYQATLATICELVQRCEAQLGEQGQVGIGTPGAISTSTGMLKNANSTWLNGKPLHRDLEQMLGREVRIANDANCFTLSEAIDGAAKDAPCVFGVIIGTGTGGGIVVNHQLIDGPNNISGEWGHNPLPWRDAKELPGEPCYCGKHGCIETYLSGPGFATQFYRATGQQSTPPNILQLATNGDRAAIRVVDTYYENLAKALAQVINILDPHVIVLGGGMSNIQSLYDEVAGRWDKYVFSDHVDTQLRKAKYGDASGVRGAAWL